MRAQMTSVAHGGNPTADTRKTCEQGPALKRNLGYHGEVGLGERGPGSLAYGGCYAWIWFGGRTDSDFRIW